MERSQSTEQVAAFIAQRISLPQKPIVSALDLLKEGATIPFIARYRKEKTGGLDEVQLETIRDAYQRWTDLEDRKNTILKSLTEQQVLTDDLKQAVLACEELNALEDLYLPYKPKRKTKASIAHEKGLRPLAGAIMKGNGDPEFLAKRFVKGSVHSVEDALEGARHIMAEWMSENVRLRNTVRRHYQRQAIIQCKVVAGKEDEGEKYRDYFDFSEEARRCKPNRFMAIKRGQREGFLKYQVQPDRKRVLEELERQVIRHSSPCEEEIRKALKDSYSRLIRPSIENEFLKEWTEKSDEVAIRIFGENLRQLLLGAPVGAKRILAIDPGFRSGCKLVCLDEQGDLLHNETIYPHAPKNDRKSAGKILTLIRSYKIDAIAIGNGTAGRETEQLIRSIRFDRDIQVFVVSEAGASVYSASKIARQEFPQYDVTVRGAVSIGRRLMDPLAELVKIEPKSIGVGQYQHDVDQGRLKSRLNQVVENCVNHVGVDVNTASKELLTYVSGLGEKLAQNLVSYRQENGPFGSREELKKVTLLGPKAFEQCAGFLRIPNADNPLDQSAVHPERYALVKKMASGLGVKLNDLVGNPELAEQIQIDKYKSEEIGQFTLNDILRELQKPGRDPRKRAKVFEFKKGLKSLNDLEEGMVVPGIVTNLTGFGAFIDIGIKVNGLVHLSEMADAYISDPTEVLSLHQTLDVKVISIDRKRNRIGLSIRQVANN